MQSGLEHLPQAELKTGNTWPLSFAQEGLWFLHELAPNNPAYNICRLLRLKGELNVEALRWSVNQIVARHETLRTSFGVCGEQPCQIISPQASLDLVTEDLSNVAESWPAARELARAEAKRPFNLRKGPLLRARLLKLAGTEHVLLLCVHHIICDGWSIEVLFSEMEEFYNCACTKAAVRLPELPVQYADYAIWQREWLQGKVLAEQLGYWREQLGGAEGVLELPTDRPRPAVRSYHGGIVQWHLSEDLTRELEQLAQTQKTTLFMVLLAAFKILLWRYTGNKDLVVGAPVANRQRLELEGLIGFVANTLALRGSINPNESFAALLAQVKETCLGGYAHQQLPFEKLVEELQPERSLAHSPLFQVMLTLQGAPRNKLNLHRVESQIEVIYNGTSKCDLDIFVTHEPSRGLKLALEYNTDLFDDQTIKRMVTRYETLLQSIVIHREQRISSLPLLTEHELHQLLVERNDTRRDFPQHACFHQLFETQVKITPEAIAVESDEGKLTYNELNQRANRLARFLVTQGAGPEMPVAVLAQRNISLLTAILAIFKAGGAYLPLDPRHPATRQVQVLTQSRTSLVLTTDDLEPDIAQALEQIIDVKMAPRVHSLEDVLEQENASDNLDSRSGSHNLAYVIFTSGSTGVPKGVMIEQRGMINHLYIKVRELGLSASDIVAQTSSQCFDISVWQFLAPLAVGARVRIFADKVAADPRALLRALQTETVSVAETVPSMLRAMLEEIPSLASAGDLLPALRWLVVTGEVLGPDICRDWKQSVGDRIRLLNAYGPTECSDDVTHYEVKQSPGEHVVRMPIGHALSNTQLYIVDREMGLVPAGMSGELCVGGVGVGRGYLYDARRTAESFVPDPFGKVEGGRLYLTGDLCRYLPDGNLEFLGRIDDQIKLRGFRIELGEIEAVLRAHDEVREALVEARHLESGTQQLVAYLVPKTAGGEEQLQELRIYLRERLPEYMVPAVFVKLEAMPLTPNGKVDRRGLPDPALHLGNGSGFIAPRSQTERELAEVWGQLLQIERIGVRDNFFDLGGHSLMATQLASRIINRFAVDLKLQDIFNAPTIEGLAPLIDAAIIEMSDEAAFDEALAMVEQD